MIQEFDVGLVELFSEKARLGPFLLKSMVKAQLELLLTPIISGLCHDA